MYAPLAAFSSAGRGFFEGKRDADDDLVKQYDLMGMQALGKAFQLQGPIDQLNARGPQPPMPGQASLPPPPALPERTMSMGGGPPVDIYRQNEFNPMDAQAQMPSVAPPAAVNPPGSAPQQAAPGAGSPPSPSPGASPVQQGPDGMPQFDLQTLVQRIQQANPNLPPQAMVSALTRATPLLNMQGKLDLAQMRNDVREQAIKVQQGFLDLKRGIGQPGAMAGATGAAVPGGLMSPQAVEAAAERYVKTGSMPPNLGRGVQGRADMAAIQNRAAELAEEKGIKAADLPKQWQMQKAEQIAIQRFMSGPQGNTMRSLNVVVDHLATMRDLALELKNGNIQVFNRIAQEFAAQTGSPAPTNFDTAKQIVGAEIIKALGIAGAGTQTERKEAADSFAKAKSPDQLMGAIKTAQKLLAGQLGGMRKQFKTATGLPESKFDEMMNDETKSFLNPTAPAAAGANEGWTVKVIPGGK